MEVIPGWSWLADHRDRPLTTATRPSANVVELDFVVHLDLDFATSRLEA
jgi:hypothetical protein